MDGNASGISELLSGKFPEMRKFRKIPDNATGL
jgi:hypothetical protein